MGTWGAGIFDDDTSCDVRGLYRRAHRAGVPGPKATDQILRAYARPRSIRCLGWLGLAAAQAQLDRLEERVKTTALEVIDSGADLAAWAEADAATRRRRRAALGRLRRRLLGPQPPPVPLKPPWRQDTTLEPGQDLLFRFTDGQQVLLGVLDVQEFEGTRPESVARWGNAHEATCTPDRSG